MREPLLNYLLADANVNAIVDGRIYWVDGLQTKTYPKVTLQVISGAPLATYSGADLFTENRVQIDCYAQSSIDCAALANEIKALLHAERFTQDTKDFATFLISERDLSEDNQSAGVRIFRISLDFQVFSK